jgi:hypothetical protein
MNKTRLVSLLLPLLGAASLLLSQATLAAESAAQAQYRKEKAACLDGSSNQDRATCLQEAGAALAESRKGNLTSGDLAHNSLARCEALPAADREDCTMRMQQGVTSGSARDGGILRESTRPAK